MKSFQSLGVILVFFQLIIFGQNERIPIVTERNRTVIPVKIDEVELKILLDTGMSFNGLLVYNPAFKDSIELKSPMKVRVPGAGSGPPSEALMDTSGLFSIGERKFEDQKILILTSGTFSGFPTDGILGYSIFGNFIVEINYDDKYLILHDFDSIDVDDSWHKIPIYFKQNTIPWMDVIIQIKNENPNKISTYIDFAAGETIELMEKSNMKFKLPENLENSYLGRGLSGDIYGKKGIISKLIIGPYELENMVAAVAEDGIRSKQPNADGIIGNGSLKYFNLIFDYKNKYLYIKPNDNYNSLIAN